MNFDKIFNQLYAYLFFIAKKHVSIEDAEDAVSHSFIALWQSREKLKDAPPANIKQFLITVLRNKIRDVRKTDKLHTIKNEYYWEYHFVVDEYDEVQAIAMSRLLNEAVAHLPKQPRQIIELTLKGYQPVAISVLLKKNITTLYNQKAFAVRFLREYIEPRMAMYT